jgi:hypothetical protein
MTLAVHLESPGVGLSQIAGSSGPLDLTIGYPVGSVVPYGVLSQTGYEPPTVLLDTSLAAAVGMLTMSRSHVINAATDTVFALRPGITDLGNRVRAVVDANNKPVAYAAFLTWSLDSAPALFGSDLAVAEAERVAEYVKFDVFTDSAALRQFDDALANYVFEVRGGGAQHTVTIISPSDYGANANRVRSRAASASISQGDTTVFVFVNGMRTLPLGAVQTANLLQRRLEQNSDSLPRSFASYYWNRNLRGGLLALADSLKCAGRAVRDASLRQFLTTLDRYALCKGISIRAALEFDDLKHSIYGFINSQWDLGLPADPDIDRLAHRLSWYHGKGKHTIAVTHSQGNLIFRDAMPLLAAYDGVPLQTRFCTAALSLAAPLQKELFGVSPPYLQGMTIRNDILVDFLGLPNNFDPLPKHYEVPDSFKADTAIMRATTAADTVVQGAKWGSRIHDVDNNYMTGTLSGQVLTFMKRLYNSCSLLPGQ